MHDDAATLLSGTAPRSLGESLAIVLREQLEKSTIIAIDKNRNSRFDELAPATSIEIDLNPIESVDTYDQLSRTVCQKIELARSEHHFSGVGTVILAAGTYDYGPLIYSTAEARRQLVGVNICGKMEVLHAVMNANRAGAFCNADELTLIDIGALHGLTSSAGRSLYSATKAFGLDLCLALHHGREVKRAIHVAPGPMDTPMLHRNHWVVKEGGPVEFFDLLKAQPGSLYLDVFAKCDDGAFAEAVSLSRSSKGDLADVFDRYKRRREAQFEDRHGVLCVSDAAKIIANIAIDGEEQPEGVYIITNPRQKTQIERLSFSSVVRRC